MSIASSLFGRESEIQVLNQLFDNVRDRGGSLSVSGGPGVGKSALLLEAAAAAAGRGMLVLQGTGVQSEALLPFAGLHQLLHPVLGRMDALAPPQRNALQAAFGLSDVVASDFFLTALAVLDLLADCAAGAPVLVIADDAQWLDRSTCDVLAFVARRLEFEPILLIAATLDGYASPLDAGLSALQLDALPRPAAAALLDTRAPGLPSSVRTRLLDQAAGNPLALTELPMAYKKAGAGEDPPEWLPLTTRLERAFAARAFDLPGPARTALLVAALNDGTLLREVLDATALLVGEVLRAGVLAPAVDARLIEMDDTDLRFRHPLMRAAIRQEASVSQRHAAHAALASVLNAQPERRVWHRAASIIGPDEAVAAELDAAATRAQQRGGTAMAVSALRGDQAAAEALAAQAERGGVPIGASAVLAAAQLARGLAALGSGRPADALEHLRRIHDPADLAYHHGIRCFTIGDLAEAALRSGARGAVSVFMDEMEAAGRQSPSPSLHAGLRYARALLADDAEADALFAAALQSDMSALPFTRARVQLAYGEWLHQRRQNAASRAHLRAAREAFDALGMIPWSERSRQQLRATGETSRPRIPEMRDQLTPQELQIVQMAAEGLSNRQIGQMLYLSHRTVSSHLYRVFPKLGITSRTELRTALAVGSPGSGFRLS